MRIYLAARYSRRVELLAYRDALAELGHVVTSRWLNGDHQISNAGVPIGEAGEALVEDGDGEAAARLRDKFANDDFEDVVSADVLVAFTEPPRSDKGRGGRHVELGIALGFGIDVLVVGPRENIFCWLASVKHFDSWAELLPTLKGDRL